MIDNVKGIIWDWNGTLLNDANLAVHTMNQMLGKRGLPLLSVDQYKSVFTFPIKEYYQRIGFDFQKEPFEVPANEFIGLYYQEWMNCRLHRGSVNVLQYFKDAGLKQFVLSAMEQQVLDKCLKYYEIDGFFQFVLGLDNIYASSKIENGLQLISEQQLNASELVLIGDTVHDYEVATELGCHCILIADGHQSKEVLQSTGTIVLGSMVQLLN
jgi:phosphoglycolate phosphatase